MVLVGAEYLIEMVGVLTSHIRYAEGSEQSTVNAVSKYAAVLEPEDNVISAASP
jgi:hypothetical protein